MKFRAPAVVAAAFLVACTLLLSPSSVRAATTVNAPSAAAALTNAALASVGKFEGECYTFMQKVVKSALGKSVGGDYRLGYLQAGAVEVTLAAAQVGDVIQLIDDRNTTPSADYPGMHTAIILENFGGGKFRVVDSNANYDGMVRVREYEPVAVATRYSNISVHVYHLTDSPVPAGGVVPPGSASVGASSLPLTPGAAAVIAADGDCLRIRAVPALTGTIVTCMPTGASLTIAGSGAEGDGYKWLPISAGGVKGWAVERYLRGVPAGASASASTSALPDAAAVGVVFPSPPPTTGTIVGGSIPAKGFGLVVYGGGPKDELVTASGCPKESAAFWASKEGEFVTFIPAATVAVVNAAWDEMFPGGMPAGTALIGRCS